MKKKTVALGLALTLVASCGALTACGNENELIVTGSSSVSPLMEKLAEAYEKVSEVDVKVTTSDSGTGIKDAMEGRNDFGMSSRALKQTETGIEAKQIATDGVVMIVNPEVELTNVTSEEVYGLYAEGVAIGAITGAISRENGSGTRDAFDDLIKNAEGQKLKQLETFSAVVGTQTNTGAVKTQIASNNTVLGYISLGSLDGTVKALSFEGVEATVENIQAGEYGLSRPFLIVYPSEETLSENAKAFLAFIMGEEGQAIVEKAGYVPVA
ncbi:MAG: substrate-binding domain-containing protein [Clostridia bacterium]|nr:substrate-binding domain-containing protein [Clostridia bacterium]